ncbi:MAG: YybH family protein [Advenella sp.]
MSSHQLKGLIASADHAIAEENVDALMNFYTDDATLVVKPGMAVQGKENIRKAFEAIADYFNHSIKVTQGEMVVIEGGDTALVIMETKLDSIDKTGKATAISRRATYVFRKDGQDGWLCVIDNSYGTDLLGER